MPSISRSFRCAMRCERRTRFVAEPSSFFSSLPEDLSALPAAAPLPLLLLLPLLLPFAEAAAAAAAAASFFAFFFS